MKYYCGIDNSSQTHSICIIDNDEKKVKSFSINNNLEGFKKLNNILTSYPNHGIGFELPHGPIVDFFRNNNKVIYSINPLKIKRFKQTTNITGDKSDPIDAFAIGLYLKRNQNFTRPMMFNTKEIEMLNIYRLSYDRLRKECTRCKHKLRFLLSQYFPLLINLFQDFGCKVLLNMILQYPTWNELKNTSKAELIEFLNDNKYRAKKNIKKLLDKVDSYDREAAQECFSLEAKAISIVLLELLKKIKEIENKMALILKKHELGEVFLSLPGTNTILASKLLAIFGDNKNRFENHKNVQCLYGTAPKNFSSGKYFKVIMRKACNKKARTSLYLYAFSSIKNCNWVRKYYDKLRNKGKTHSVALRALSNKWVKVIFSMWKNNKVYDDNLYPINENNQNQLNKKIA